jgi:hypothetical protein
MVTTTYDNIWMNMSRRMRHIHLRERVGALCRLYKRNSACTHEINYVLAARPVFSIMKVDIFS